MSAATPSPPVATVGTTGVASTSAKASASTETPRARASSVMLSAIASGTPSSAKSAVRFSVRRRFLASPTCTIRRRFSFSNARIVARSSSLREGSASTPGVSSSEAVLSKRAVARATSTVVPG